MSFRLRLFLSMLLLVAAVTAAALAIAERSMRAAFAGALEARLEERLGRVARERELRAEEARGLAAAVARDVRLQAALIVRADDPESMPGDVVYENAENALEARKPGAGWTLRLVDAAGQAIAAGEEREAQGRALVWKPAPAAVAAALTAGHERRGLLPSATSAGWWKATLLPVTNTENDALLGGLLLAQKASGEVEHAGDLRTALLLDGRVVTPGLPSLGEVESGRREIVLEGEPHAAFWQPLDDGRSGIFPRAVEVSIFSLAERERQQRELRRKVLGAGAAALAVAALVALGLSQGLTRPIRELVRVTEAIRRSDYSARAAARGGEFGTLATAFNAMAGDLALKDKYRNLLDLTSDPHVAEELLASGLELGGEEREVSVVFCDIRGFTRLSEGMAPREVIEMLNEHFTPLTRVVHEHGGVVLHFVGDLIIALFGAPRRCAAAERSAAACALGLVRERERLNGTGARHIEVGVGVATGRMVAGRMGSKDRLNYSVFGARMNLASRLCGQAGPMQIVIDAPTLAGCGAAAQARALGALKLKGFSEEIEAFQLLALDGAASGG